MTEEEYRERRADWINNILRINKRFFPRCFGARMRELAKLDAEHDGRDYKEVQRELSKEFDNET